MPENEVAGVAEQPQTSTINECDGLTAQNEPGESAGNPALCRTFGPDARIVAELARVRRINHLFPPPSRGLIYFNFKDNRVAIAAVQP